MKSKTNEYLEIIVLIVLKHLPDAKIILYGSRARKDDRQGSDIDVAIDIGKAIDDKIMILIQNDIEDSLLPVPFDVVDFYTVSSEMQKKIVEDGVVWQK